MAVLSTLAQLEEVQAAISAVMSAQSYTLHDRTVTKANLSELNKREEMLLARYNREVNGKGARVRNAVLG